MSNKRNAGPQQPKRKPLGRYWPHYYWPCYPGWYHTWDDYDWNDYDYDYDTYDNYDDWYDEIYTSAYEKGLKEGRRQGLAHAVRLGDISVGNCSPWHSNVAPSGNTTSNVTIESVTTELVVTGNVMPPPSTGLGI